MKCVPYVQHILNYFHCFFTSTIEIAPVQTILYQFKLFCPSSKTNCSKVKIELQHIYVIYRVGSPFRKKKCAKAEGYDEKHQVISSKASAAGCKLHFSHCHLSYNAISLTLK